ncbi:transglycosylase SLT domain-containing protein [Roseibium sp. SCPC15]|uniref:transglycosylase SLT domain-containing protein n=1 Tax=Roseibium sp. SCP15 TaxID=3141376 RepID=UPI003339E2A8
MHVADTTSIASRIELAFESASNSTGTSFEYLVKTAARESSFNPAAKAQTSSATGLFQFIESTWLETMKEAGPRHGLDKYSDQIQRTSNGKYHVSDPKVRQEILDLRKDPEISSMMAGALTQKNASYLERRIGRAPTDGELYMAHFLGANGASRLIDAALTNPETRADSLFSTQAKANKPIFYHPNGNARSMEEVYEVIVSKHNAVTMIAEAGGKKNTGLSSGIASVAALPSAKPAHPSQLVDQNSFDHLAGDPAAAFAVRAKPPAPGQQFAATGEGDGDRSLGEAVELAKVSVPIPNRRPDETSATGNGEERQADESVVAKSAPAAQPPLEASINGSDLERATNQVLSAFQASDTGNPFEAMFRNDAGSSEAGVNPRFASAFQAVEEAAPFSTLSGASSQVTAQELALADQGGPLDLTRFLRLKAEEEQKDLLPPA